jgi:hypothetical protein
VLTNAASPTAAVRCSDGWRSVSAPAQATTVRGDGADAYVVAGDRLWRSTVPTC